MNDKDSFGLVFGALCDGIASQLDVQGLVARKPEELALWQRQADAITLLSVHGLLSDSEKHRSRQRLMKRITVGVERVGHITAEG